MKTCHLIEKLSGDHSAWLTEKYQRIALLSGSFVCFRIPLQRIVCSIIHNRIIIRRLRRRCGFLIRILRIFYSGIFRILCSWIFWILYSWIFDSRIIHSRVFDSRKIRKERIIHSRIFQRRLERIFRHRFGLFQLFQLLFRLIQLQLVLFLIQFHGLKFQFFGSRIISHQYVAFLDRISLFYQNFFYFLFCGQINILGGIRGNHSVKGHIVAPVAAAQFINCVNHRHRPVHRTKTVVTADAASGNSNREKDRNNHIPFFHSASASFDFNLPSLISTIRSAKEAIPGS